MERRRSFRPESVGPLEARLVLHHSRALSVVVAGLNPQNQVINGGQQSIAAEVDQAFNSFTTDYNHARATYFASIQGVTSPSADTKNAFKYYTKQRVSLLAQQIISSFLQSPNGASRAPKEPPVLKQLITQKIINVTGDDPAGSLDKSLMQNIPPAGTSAPTASLYSISQDLAIQTARYEVINGMNIVDNGDFGVQSPHK